MKKVFNALFPILILLGALIAGLSVKAQNIGDKFYLSDSSQFEIVQAVFNQDLNSGQMWLDYSITAREKLSKSQSKEAKRILKQISAGIKVYMKKKYHYVPNQEDYQKAELAFKKIQVTEQLIEQKHAQKKPSILVENDQKSDFNSYLRVHLLDTLMDVHMKVQYVMLPDAWVSHY